MKSDLASEHYIYNTGHSSSQKDNSQTWFSKELFLCFKAGGNLYRVCRHNAKLLQWMSVSTHHTEYKLLNKMQI